MRVLETERMTLRWFDEADAPFVLDLLNDPDFAPNPRALYEQENVRTVISVVPSGSTVTR